MEYRMAKFTGIFLFLIPQRGIMFIAPDVYSQGLKNAPCIFPLYCREGRVSNLNYGKT